MVPLNVSFSALPGWRRSAGLLFLRGKSRQKRAGETPDPLFLPNRSVSGEIPGLPPNFQLSFVIGAMVYGLRLTALESIGTSNDAKQIDGSIPLAGRQPKLEKILATDQMPEGISGSVATQRPI